jgi:hypothetical protein
MSAQTERPFAGAQHFFGSFLVVYKRKVYILPIEEGLMKTSNRKQLYLALWVLAGILLGVLIGGLIEYIYLISDTITISNYIIYGLSVLFGIIFGIWAGPIGWRKIYIEGARGKKYVVGK